MSVLNREEMLNKVQQFIGEDKSDEAIALLEDINDTFADDTNQELQTLRNTNQRLEQEKEEIDKNWREKYKSRFFDGEINNNDDDDIDDTPKKLSYENLFKES